MPDAHANFAYSTVATAPSPALSGTSLVVAAATGGLFPVAPFNATIWPAGTQATAANAEIVRVTAVSSDTLTIVRAQESTAARTVLVGDQIAATITKKMVTDLEFLPLVSKSANYSVLATDCVILASNGCTLTMPNATTVGAGKVFYVKKVDTSTAVITIATSAAQTIDGESYTALNDPQEGLMLVSDGSNWQVL